MHRREATRRTISALKLNLGNIRRPRIGALFWWTIIIVLLGICTILSWTLSIYIFNHPNEPVPYRILTNLNKLPAPERFKPGSPPSGKFHAPRQLMENNFAGLDAELLAFSNKILLRDYLENFKRSESVIYISGSFTVNQVRKLQPEDLFIDGTVLSAHLTDFPKASIELILPGAMLASDTSINSGQPLELTKPFFAALIHVAKPSKELMRFTVVPIVYGQHQIGTTKVSLSPPPILNIEGKWPLTSDTAP
jgi:hypothetical protein